jgi:hypothetical protein
MRRAHWFREEVRTIATTLDELPRLLPVFDRYGLGSNRFHDVIVRRDRGGQLPVATVSKNYVLVQHADAVKAMAGEVRQAGIHPADVPAELLITEYGTRVAIRATLPDAYAFREQDGTPMALTFELFNSVDRTVPFMAAIGWFRFVCHNGLVLGTTAAKIRRRHSTALKMGEVSAVLAEGLKAAIHEREIFETWEHTCVDDEALIAWVDGPVCAAWGPSAAARVYAVATDGYDGVPEKTRGIPPHARVIKATQPVPGTSAPESDAYGVAQVLAWVASRRGNVAERLRWRGEIPQLMDDLLAG